MKCFLFFLILAAQQWAHAFPEMVRHGYTHCIACHTSITGGGLLNEYGRNLSQELLSQKVLFGRPSVEGDGQFLGGLVPSSENSLWGGDIRLLQTFAEDSVSSRARFLIMQVQLDFSAKLNSWLRFFASVGRIEPRKTDPVASDYVYSPQHGIELTFTPEDSAERLSLRMGRFMPAYGILFQEHTLVTRRFLDFQPGQERLAAELAWTNESYSVIATGILNQNSGNTNLREQGGALQVSRALGSSSKIGANYYQSNRKKIFGVFAHIGFSEKTYGLFELDQPIDVDTRNQGLIEVFKLGHELYQGLHLVGIQEFANMNVQNSNPKYEAFSVGTQWFPRSHWDLYGLLRKERNTLNGNEFQDQAWLIGHYYL